MPHPRVHRVVDPHEPDDRDLRLRAPERRRDAHPRADRTDARDIRTNAHARAGRRVRHAPGRSVGALASETEGRPPRRGRARYREALTTSRRAGPPFADPAAPREARLRDQSAPTTA